MSGSAVDASIALNANAPKPINPLVQVGQYAQTLGGLTSLQQARINIAKQNALAQAYQGAQIDARTGLPDAASVTSSLQASPYGGLAIPDAIQANQAMRLNAIKNAQASSQVYTSTVGALARLGSSVTNGQVYGALKALNIAGYPGVDKMVEQAQDGMPVDPTGSDPQHGQKLHDWLMNTYLRDVGPGVETQAVVPDYVQVNQGNQTSFVNRSATTNPDIGSTAKPMGFTPDQLATPVQIGTNPDGSKQMGTLADYLRKNGYTPGQFSGGGAAATPGAPLFPNGVRPPAAPPSAPPPAVAAPAPEAPAPQTTAAADAHPGITIGLPAGAAEAYAASSLHYANDVSAAGSFKQRVFPLQEAAAALKNSDTGPGSETVNNIKSFLMAQTPASLQKYLPNVDPSKITDYDLAMKYLAQYTRAQPGAQNSDMQAGLAQVANASTHINNAAAREVVQNATGLERMRQALTLEFDKTHPVGSGYLYNSWLAKQSAQYDPRAFAADMMDPTQIKTMLAGMKPEEKKMFLNTYRFAVGSGLLSAGNVGQ